MTVKEITDRPEEVFSLAEDDGPSRAKSQQTFMRAGEKLLPEDSAPIINVKEITDKKMWQDFIEKVKPSTFLHGWEAGEIERELGRTIFRFGIWEGTELVAVALFVKIEARRGKFLLCPHGPIVAQGKLTESLIVAIRNEAVRLAKNENCSFVRISTTIIDTPRHRDFFKQAGFRDAPIHMHSELSWILDVTPSEEELLTGMKKNTRYSIRKAEKDGVVVRASTSMDDFETFWNIYMATVSRQHFTPFPRSYLEKEFAALFKENRAVLFFGEYQNQAIATAFVVYSNGSGFYHHGASNNTFPGITPSEKVQWEAIREAKRRGFSHYNFWGVVPDEATTHPWFGLSKFKKSFGGYAESYVHAQDYVITSAYWLNYIVERIRKIKRRV